MPITFPSPVQCFEAVTKAVEGNNHTLLAASIKPRATWDGNRYDIAYTGYFIAQSNRRGILIRWAYALRHSERTLNTVLRWQDQSCDSFYGTTPTYDGLVELLTHSQREGAWHLCRDHDGVWIEVNNEETLASYLVDRMAAPIAV
jgi:hypothetical protein